MRLKKVKGAFDKIIISKYYIDKPEENKGKWKEYFNNKNPIHIEIGMGKGTFIIEMAKKNPNINYIGIEMYDSVLVRAIEALELEEKLDNLRLLLFDARNIEEIFEKEIEQILKDVGFERKLTNNQLGNLTKISRLPGAATFSVPGAGKTTEALAYFFINLVLDCEDNNLYVRDEIIGKQRELKIRKEEI